MQKNGDAAEQIAAKSEETACPKRRRADGRATRKKLLDAARAVILEEGTDKLRIERVINRAGVRKGTYLYHFPTREHLIEALANEYAAHLYDVQQTTEEVVGEERDPILAGYEKWYRDFSSGAIDNGNSPLISLVAASRENDRFLEPVREWYRGHFSRLEKSPCGEAAALMISMATAALFFHRLFGTDVLEDGKKEELLALMHDIAQGEVEIRRLESNK